MEGCKRYLKGADGWGSNRRAQKVFEGHRWVGMVMEWRRRVGMIMGCLNHTFSTLTQ